MNGDDNMGESMSSKTEGAAKRTDKVFGQMGYGVPKSGKGTKSMRSMAKKPKMRSMSRGK
jgi:hypothetical protein